MTQYLLDTDALIDFSKGVEPATSLILSWIDGTDVVAVSSISVAEFFASLTREQATQREAFITSLSYWVTSREAAMRAGQDRYALARAGFSITTTDALLAAVAREHDATLVTGNVKDFPMQNLILLSLR